MTTTSKGNICHKKIDDKNYLPILSPLILNYVYDVFIFGYKIVKTITKLDWEMPDPTTNLTIPDFEKKYKVHKTNCEKAAKIYGNDLKYCMDYDIIVKIKINDQEIAVTADEKVCFNIIYAK